MDAVDRGRVDVRRVFEQQDGPDQAVERLVFVDGIGAEGEVVAGAEFLRTVKELLEEPALAL